MESREKPTELAARVLPFHGELRKQLAYRHIQHDATLVRHVEHPLTLPLS